RRSATAASTVCTAPDPAATSALSLHDALPIWRRRRSGRTCARAQTRAQTAAERDQRHPPGGCDAGAADHLHDLGAPADRGRPRRSEEHTSELQSREKLVCRLLLEKQKAKLEWN